MNDEILDWDKHMRLMEKKREVFGSATALFDSRFVLDNGQVPQLEQARRYAYNWETMQREGLGLLFWGQPGNGKTFAAACIANHLVEKEDFFPPKVKMTTLGTVLNRLPSMSAQDKEYYLTKFLEADLLILDDLGMERQTDYAREQIFQLIDGRYLTKRPLIVTTNISLREMKQTNDLAQKRIYDRVLEMCVPVYFDGSSQRTERAARNLQRFRELTGAQS